MAGSSYFRLCRIQKNLRWNASNIDWFVILWSVINIIIIFRSDFSTGQWSSGIAIFNTWYWWFWKCRQFSWKWDHTYWKWGQWFQFFTQCDWDNRWLKLKSLKTISSHLQLRGSVPSFWEQPGINFGQHKCDIIRKTEGSISAARRHFKRIAQLYSNCHVVNLLGKGDGESKVSNQYEEIVNQLQVHFK